MLNDLNRVTLFKSPKGEAWAYPIIGRQGRKWLLTDGNSVHLFGPGPEPEAEAFLRQGSYSPGEGGQQ